MKKLFLLLTLSVLIAGCSKEQSVEPKAEPTLETRATVSHSATIQSATSSYYGGLSELPSSATTVYTNIYFPADIPADMVKYMIIGALNTAGVTNWVSLNYFAPGNTVNGNTYYFAYFSLKANTTANYRKLTLYTASDSIVFTQKN